MSQPIDPELLVFDIVTAGEPRISPDGTQILYALSSTDRGSKRVSSQLWLCDVNGGNARRITWSGERNREGRWSPDGSQIAFVSDRVKKNGIFVLPVAGNPLGGGEARELCRHIAELSEIVWSPDGKQIAYTARVDPDNPGEAEPAPGSAPPVRVTRRLDYKADGLGYVGDVRRQVFVVDVATGERRQLTNNAVDHNRPLWSPDGREIAVQIPNNNIYQQLGLIDVESGATKLIGPETGIMGVWSYSPTGDRILYAGDDEHTGHLDFFIYTTATGEIIRLTDDVDCLPDAGRLGQAPAALFQWLDERMVLFHGFRAGASGLYTLDTKTGNVEKVRGGNVLNSGLSLDDAQRFVVQTQASLESLGEIVVFDRQTNTSRIITANNDALFQRAPLAKWERFEIQRAGLTIEAWLLKPPDFDSNKKYPVILDVHGGPQAFAGYGVDPVQQLLATHGFLVVYSNPRGSVTYGRDFTLQVRKDWGGGAYHDIMAVLDAVLERPYADRERTGIYGSSYGGYMVAWVIGQTHRFKAAIGRAPVYDLTSFYGTSDIGHSWGALQQGGPPHLQREQYAAQSPSTFAHRATTPTLIMVGEADERCNIGQSEQMFVDLKNAGCEVEFVRYPGGSHLFFRPGGPPEHRLDFFRRVLGWFKERLGDPV